MVAELVAISALGLFLPVRAAGPVPSLRSGTDAAIDAIHELLAPRSAAEKLGARAISIDEAQQLIDNRYVIVRNTGRSRRRECELARRS